MAEVTQETLAILTLLLPQDSILQISRYKNREAELINQIAQQVLHASTQTALLIQEKERQAAEYEREVARLDELREVTGIKKSRLSAEGQADVALLAQLASKLELSNPRASSIVAATAQECLHITNCELRKLASQRKQKEIIKDTSLVQAKVQQLQQLHQSLAEQVPQMRADAKQQQDAIRTICSKQARYKQQQQRLLEELRESYFDPSITHREIMKLDGQVNAAMVQRDATQQQLESYRELPANLPDAQAAVRRAQKELQQLKEQYATHMVSHG